jgi:hypothetical protein
MPMHLTSLGVGAKTGSATTLVHDLFNSAANGTNLSAETPAVGPSPHPEFNPDGTLEFQIQSGTANATNAGGASDIYLALGQSDVTMNSFATWGSGADLTYIVRFQDISNYWQVTVSPGDQTMYLIETLGGAPTTRATANVGPVSGGYNFKAQTSGTSISGDWNAGAGVVSFTSSDPQSAQAFGIGAALFAGVSTSADNFGPLTITHP